MVLVLIEPSRCAEAGWVEVDIKGPDSPAGRRHGVRAVFTEEGAMREEEYVFSQEGKVWERSLPIWAQEDEVSSFPEELVSYAHKLAEGRVGPDGLWIMPGSRESINFRSPKSRE